MLILQSHEDISELTPSFTSEELSLVREYIADSERLAATVALQRPPRFMAMCLTENGPRTTFKPELSDADVDALLHRLRPFILQSEPYSFVRIRKLADRRLENRAIHAVLKKELEEYDSRAWQRELRIQSGAATLNSEEVLDLWLNSNQYHRDQDKKESLQQILEKSIPGLQYWAAIKMLIRKASAVLRVATLLRVIVGCEHSVDFTINGVAYTLRNG